MNMKKHVCTITLLIWPVLAASAGTPTDGERVHAFETGLRPAVLVQGAPGTTWTLEQRMAHWKIPGVSVAVIRNGRVAWARGYGVKEAGTNDRVDADTVFSVGSVSKVGAAAVTLRLVDAGRLALDRDVNDYITRWKVPASAYTVVRPVTLRGILSHSAGLSVSGFPDFQPGDALPGIVDTLQGRPPAKTEAVRVIESPGTTFRYSGGGTTIEQLVIEEQTGLSFPEAARRYVLEPLHMGRSTYENPLPASHGNIARAHDAQGKPTALPRGWESMPETAASGLWTTPGDYAKLVIALIESYRGARDAFISTTLARDMMTEVGPSRVGLGPFLDGHGLTRRFSHSGANDSYRAWMEGHLATGNGAVIFTNGSNGTRLIPEVRRAIAAAEGWAMTGSLVVPKVEISAAQLEEFAGIYAVRRADRVLETRQSHVPKIAYRVFVENGRLRLADAGAGEGSVALIPEGPLQFVAEDDSSVRIEFVRGYDGKLVALVNRLEDYAVQADKAR